MKDFTLREKILGVLALPISLPLFSIIYLIMYITKGNKLTNESASDFTFRFIDAFRSDIYELLNINNTPAIYLADEISSKQGEFRAINSSSSFRFIDSLFNSNSSKTFHSSIIVNYNSIGKRYLYNNFITKLVMVNTIVHELTHYAQYVQDRWEPNHSSSYQEYREEPCEVEARQKALMFSRKNFLKIVKFIIN